MVRPNRSVELRTAPEVHSRGEAASSIRRSGRAESWRPTHARTSTLPAERTKPRIHVAVYAGGRDRARFSPVPSLSVQCRETNRGSAGAHPATGAVEKVASRLCGQYRSRRPCLRVALPPLLPPHYPHPLPTPPTHLP